MQASLDWKNRFLIFRYKNKEVGVPMYCTKGDRNVTWDEESESDEYEDEDLEETPIYYSDLSDSYDEADLEYNPWVERDFHQQPTEQNDESEDEIDGQFEENPAIYLAQAAPSEEWNNKLDLHLGPLDHHQQASFQDTMGKYADICAKSQTDIGRTDIIKHQIITGDAHPIKQQAYRCNPKNKDFLKAEIVKMEQQGIVQKSISPWASPVVIVDKKGGEKRICIDYRKLNAVTKTDAYPLPRIDDTLESFRGAHWFSTLDLASGYWQVAVDQEDVEKTAFITPFGLYEFIVMPFGLKNAPGTFQRLMNYVLQDFLGKFVLVYLDDVIIYTKGGFETHLDHLKQVFETLRRANLKIKLKKCYFCLPNIHFLGHVVGRDGILPDPEKIEKIKNFPIPTNLTQLRSALGLFSYYRKFIKDFSKIARPMLSLLKKDTPFNWTNKQQQAFEYLKERLVKSPVLKYPDFERSFIIYTDASGTGLGAVLAQEHDDGKEHVIAYASRSMNQAERNYTITDQECLAVIWAVKYFHHYLGLQPFTIVTDHAALKWLQTSHIPKGRRARWMMELQQYDYQIKHRPGKTNANADALSRMYNDFEEQECFMVLTQDDDNEPLEPEDSLQRICITCGNVSGSKSWSRKHYYSYAATNYDHPWICDYTQDYADIRDLDQETKAHVYLAKLMYPNESLNQALQKVEKVMTNTTLILQADTEDEDEDTQPSAPRWKGKAKEDESEEERIISLEDYQISEGSCEAESDNGTITPNRHVRDFNFTAYQPYWEEYEQLFMDNIQIKSVIANQPIRRGGSKCTEACDTENHHIHTYCRLCKRNLVYGTVVHDCVVGYGCGKIHPEMVPEYLINTPWWNEPLAVQYEDYHFFLSKYTEGTEEYYSS